MFGDNDIAVLFGDGEGSFGPPTSMTAGMSPWYIVAEDVNGDDQPDLVVANWFSGDLSVCISHGDGNFADAASYPAGESPFGIALGDFDGDHIVDVAATDYGGKSISILRGLGDGTFASAVSVAVGEGAAGIAVGDFNQDGRPDLATTLQGSGEAVILLNETPGPGDANRDGVVDGQDFSIWNMHRFTSDGAGSQAISTVMASSMVLISIFGATTDSFRRRRQRAPCGSAAVRSRMPRAPCPDVNGPIVVLDRFVSGSQRVR